jgi:hypothetical protein
MPPISPMRTSSSSLMFMHLAYALSSFILLGQQQSRLTASDAIVTNHEFHHLVAAHQQSSQWAWCLPILECSLELDYRQPTQIMVSQI